MKSEWGVACDGVVVRASGGEAAFLREGRLRAAGWDARVVVRVAGTWRVVPWESALRADPRPPERAVAASGVRGVRWWRAWAVWARRVVLRPVKSAEPVVFRKVRGGYGPEE